MSTMQISESDFRVAYSGVGPTVIAISMQHMGFSAETGIISR